MWTRGSILQDSIFRVAKSLVSSVPPSLFRCIISLCSDPEQRNNEKLSFQSRHHGSFAAMQGLAWQRAGLNVVGVSILHGVVVTVQCFRVHTHSQPDGPVYHVLTLCNAYYECGVWSHTKRNVVLYIVFAYDVTDEYINSKLYTPYLRKAIKLNC